ncbi:hypothetical protein [Geitlerinema sp. PCC 7407]|uniref:hypothetical protein n=1 Tax=Geitlerinema sp. PCC 7407 TaxID=1173025 RepID=UPI00029FFECD|nr:hypothetical protein [Geitlerinema sp. PCC 7407]AFY65747.1 hypothetical protein GEI7407_1253 [Geitlerinema sp. PCC 7407]
MVERENRRGASKLDIPGVSPWEVMAIATGAVAIVTLGLLGLSLKAITNAFDPTRAQAIAQNLVDYTIPGGSTGGFGLNLGGIKVALVGSSALVSTLTAPEQVTQQLPDGVMLRVTRLPIDRLARPEDFEAVNFSNHFGITFAHENLEIYRSYQEDKVLCGFTVPITIQTGSLTLTEAAPATPAVQYEVNLTFGNYQRLFVITGFGRNAQAEVEQVFQSLRCNR